MDCRRSRGADGPTHYRSSIDVAQSDEGLVTNQHVDAVEEEGHVVELEVSDTHSADIEELLGDEIQVTHHDQVDRKGLQCTLELNQVLPERRWQQSRDSL